MDPEDEWPESLKDYAAKFVIIGIPEDIGVRANSGMGGTDTAWLPFLNAFLNCQSNDYLSGELMLLLGHFDFGDLKFLIESHAYNQTEKLIAYRHAVQTIDEEVENIVKYVASSDKIPIVIGGGSNNSYPMLKAVSKGLQKEKKIDQSKMNAICLSAHSGYGASEGRHSGNGFRYAYENGYLDKLALIGLHENQISQNTLFELESNHLVQTYMFEDIYLYEKFNLIQSFANAIDFTDDGPTGIELCLDAVQGVLTSSHFPTGITTTEARQFVHFMGSRANAAYLHIAEGACQMGDGRKDDSTGRLISQLILDFVTAAHQQLRS